MFPMKELKTKLRSRPLRKLLAFIGHSVVNMSKKFNIHEWFLPLKYWSLPLLPHVSICLVFLGYMLLGASIIQEIESEESFNSLSIKALQRERERLLVKIIEKRQTLDLQQYTRYVYKHLRQYELELKKQIDLDESTGRNFSNSLFFLGNTLTTIGSNEFAPKTNAGKLFLIVYTGVGIPLTLVFLTDLSYLIQGLIEYISFLLFEFYSTRYFLRLRRWDLFHFLETRFRDSLQEDSAMLETNLTVVQLILTLSSYILVGAWFIPSKSFFDSVYLCFTIIFTISFNRKQGEAKNLFVTSIYLFIGLAIGLLYVRAVKIRIERFLENLGRQLLRNLVEFTQQLGYQNLTSDDLLTDGNSNAYRMKKSDLLFTCQMPRARSVDQQTSYRPVGIAEPFRRLSTGIIGRLKNSDNEPQRHFDKSVQVTTIIRRCGRCADSSLPILPVRRHSVISTSPSSMSDVSSGADDEETMDFPPPNLDRIRQRRATLVAKTIINQMATQPQSSSIDDILPTLPLLSNIRRRSSNPSLTYSVKSSTLSPPKPTSHYDASQEEFSQLSKQIAALLTPSDDEA